MPHHLSSLRGRLLTIVLVSILPVALCAAGALFVLLRNEESQAMTRALETNRQTAAAVRVTLNRSFAVLKAVAQSPLIDGNDLKPFRDLLGRVLPVMPGWHSILLASPEGQIIERVAPRSNIQNLTLVEPISFTRVLHDAEPVVGALGQGPSGVWALPLRVPVIRQANVRYVLTATLLPEEISEALMLSNLPEGWTVSVFDDNGRRIARVPSAHLPVGREVSAELMTLVRSGATEGTGLTHTSKGEEVYTAYIHLPDLNWTVATGIPTAEVKAKVMRASLLYGGGLFISLLLASLGALLAARRISEPMRELRNAAKAIGRQESPDLPDSNINEIQSVVVALGHSAQALASSEQARSATLANLATAHKQLQEADRLKDEYLATLAHELRNPLALMTQSAALMSSSGSTSDQRDHSLMVIDRQVGHLSRLLDDLLDVSRINIGKISLRIARLDLVPLLREAWAFVQVRAQEKHLNLRLSLPDSSIYVEGDGLRLQQLFANLLDNAVKYTPVSGSIQLEVQRDAALLKVAILDDGIGIAKEDMQDIFRLFGRVASPSLDVGGLGVGLALAKSLVELHRGEICVTSPGLGQGSCFTVTLPLSADQSQPEEVLQEAQVAISASRRLLIADDNADIASSLEAIFEMEGHYVRVANDGSQAVALCREEMPEVAILDIGMPNMDGHQAAQAIRLLPGGDAVFLIALSGWGRPEDVDKAKSSGFNRHLTKPANLEQLLALVASADVRGTQPSD